MENGLLFPELGEDAATEFHSLQRLLGYLHLAVNDVQAALYLLQLLWAQVRVSRAQFSRAHAQQCASGRRRKNARQD
jgi:hypothetical protein